MNCVPLVLFSGVNFTCSHPEYLNFLYLTLAFSIVIEDQRRYVRSTGVNFLYVEIPTCLCFL